MPSYGDTKMADINSLVDQLSELTVLEAADLAKALEEKWGVSAAAAVAVAGPAGGGPAPGRMLPPSITERPGRHVNGAAEWA